MTTPQQPVSGEWFPCRITMPDGTEHATVRLVAEANRATVYGWDKASRGAVALVDEPVQLVALPDLDETCNGHACRQWLIEVGDEVAIVTDQHGCGCSHPMKRWRPPKPRRAGT